MKNKKRTQKILKVGSLGLLGLSTPIGLTKVLLNSNVSYNSNIDIDYKSTNKENSKSAINSNFTLNSSNYINVKKSDGSSYSFTPVIWNSKSLTSGPRGILATNRSTGTLDYISNEGVLLWQYAYSSNVNNTFIDSNFIIASAYYEAADVFLVACTDAAPSLSGTSFVVKLFTINENTGKYVSMSNKVTFYKGQNPNGDANATNEWYKNCFMTQVVGKEGDFILWNQNYKARESGAEFVYITINSNGSVTTHSEKNFTSLPSASSSYSIVAANSIYINGSVYTLTVELYTGTNRYYLTVYKNFSFVTESAHLDTVNSGLNNEALQRAISEIYLKPKSDGKSFEYAYIDNIRDDNGSYIYYDTVDTSNITAPSSGMFMSLNSGKPTYKIKTGGIYGDYAYLYAYDENHNSFDSASNRIVRLYLGDSSLFKDSNNFIWDGDYSNYKISLWDLPKINIHDEYKSVVVPFGGEKANLNSNIFYIPNWLNYISSTKCNYDYSLGIQIFNGDKAGFAYNTKQTTTEFNLTSLSSVLAINATAEQIKEAMKSEVVLENIATQFRNTTSYDIKIRIEDLSEEKRVKGIVPITLTINNGYSGNSINAEKISLNYDVKGFKTISTSLAGTTSFNLSELKNGNAFYNTSLNDLNDTDLKDLIIANIDKFYVDAPTNLTRNDISVSILNKYGKQGLIKFKIVLNNRYVNGEKDTSGLSTATISLNGFLINNPTNTSDINLKSSDLGFTSDVSVNQAKQNDVIKTKLLDYINSQKTNLNIPKKATINFTESSSSSENGTISGNFTLSSYYDSNGNEQPQGRNIRVTVSGFNTTTTTLEGTTSYTLNDLSGGSAYSSISTNDISDSNLKDLILKNIDKFFVNAPSNLTTNDFSISIINKYGNQGLINFKIILNKKYIYGDISTNALSTENISLTGFLVTPPTELKSPEYTVTGNFANQIASSVSWTNANAFIRENFNNIFNNLASNTSIYDITLGSSDPHKGTLDVSIRLQNYYDSNGNIQTNKSNYFSLKLVGFIQTNTSVVSNINEQTLNSLTNGSNYISYNVNTITESQISQLMVDNISNYFTNTPSGITSSDLSVSITQRDGINGKIKVNATLNKIYVNGEVVTSSSKTVSDVWFSGFNATNPTNTNPLNLFVNDVGIDETLKVNEAWDNNTIKEKLTSYIESKKVILNIPSDATITINKTSTNETQGTFNGQIELSKYYDQYGVLQTNSINIDVTITGFRVNDPSVVDNFTIVNPTEIGLTTSSIPSESIEKAKSGIEAYLKNPINNKNLPSDVTFSWGTITTNNPSGTMIIEAVPSVIFANGTGKKVPNSSEKYTITINNLGTRTATNFSAMSSLTSIDLGYSNATIISDVESDIKTKVEEKLKSDSSVNLPNDVTFSSNDLINNYDGTATITIKPDNYYDDQGLVVSNSSNKVFTINLSGFGTRSGSISTPKSWTVSEIGLTNPGLASENSSIESKVNEHALTLLSDWNLPSGTTFRIDLASTNNLTGTAVLNL